MRARTSPRDCSRSTRRSATGRCAARSTTDSSGARSCSGASASRTSAMPRRSACTPAATISSRGAGLPAARYDWSERAIDPSLKDKAGSVLLTYWPSEFSQVRGQYRRTRLRGRRDGQRVAVPVPVFDRRARRARVLRMCSHVRSRRCCDWMISSSWVRNVAPRSVRCVMSARDSGEGHDGATKPSAAEGEHRSCVVDSRVRRCRVGNGRADSF